MMSPVLKITAIGILAALTGGCSKDSDADRGDAGGGPGIGGSITLDPVATEGGSSGVTDGGASSSGSAGSTGGSTGGASNSGADEGDGPKFDLGQAPDVGMSPDTGMIDCKADPNNPDCMCTIPDHVPCDDVSDPFRAMGLNCPGELQVDAKTNADPGAVGVRSTFGAAGIFNAREGAKYAVIGSGFVADLGKITPQGDFDIDPTHCNDDLQAAANPGANLPAPIKINPSGDCTQGVGLGAGDCSGTIQGQFNQGGGAYDYAELRFTLQVPPDVTSFSYDFAFFSVEYPAYYGSGFNDMYIGWLESEKWTGNISFDQNGNPISLNAGFLSFKDDGGNSQVFAGTCMRQHAGTNWLTTTAGVTPGETITVVFAIFDLSDGILDSYAFLDNFKWGCEPQGKPQTMPPG